MPELSIIIPVYNSEKYLEKCLESIRTQTFNDFEVICVDDGSVDNSGIICDRYAAFDARFKVIHQNNSGAAVARKNGINQAKSEYLTFVDSDDYIEVDYYEKMLREMDNYDIVTSGYFRDDKPKKYYDGIPFGTYTTEKELEYFYNNMIMLDDFSDFGIAGFLVTKLYRTKLMKEIISDILGNIYYHEDNELTYKYLLKCNSIKISEICGYHYVTNLNSVCNSKHQDFMININNFYLKMLPILSSHKYADTLIKQFQYRTMKDIIIVPNMLGFNPEIGFIKYFCPFPETFEKNKVILYGAGEIGKSYFKHLKKINALPFMWVDKNKCQDYDGFKISSVDEMLSASFDYVVIAVKQKYLADSIRQELTQYGVPDEKILWKKPVGIY